MFFKKRLQSRVLERLEKRASSIFVPLQNAKKIIFLIESDEDLIENSADFLIVALEERGIQWQCVVIDKGGKKSVDFSQKERFLSLTLKDLNFFGLPKGLSSIEEFKYEYDILIDMSAQFDFTSNYLSRYINAKFKVGRYSNGDDSSYDFIAKTTDNSSLQFVKQVIFYLESIKPAKL